MEDVAQLGILRMFRADAAQHYPIKRATWGFSTDEKYRVPILSFAIEAEKQKSIFPEDGGWPHTPVWVIDIWMRGLNAELLRDGCSFSIPHFYDDLTGVIYTNYYYDEHEGTEDNSIKIVGISNDILKLSIEGYIRHKHASMRPTKITGDAEFTRLSPHPPIMSKFGGRESLPPHEPPVGATYHQT
jgi:hypothetical protein